MFAIRRPITSRRTLFAATALGCVAALWVWGASSSASSATRSSTRPWSVTWMRGYAAPGTPAKYNKVGVIKVGPSGAKNVLVLEPGTSAAAAYFVPLAKWIVSKTTWLAGLVGRATGEPARGPVGTEPVQGAQGHDHAAVRLLPRLPQESEHHASLSAGRELDRRIRQAVGNERRRPGPARGDRRRQEARRQGRARWPLARRIGGDGVCHLGLRRPRRSRPTWRAWSTSMAAAPRPR